MIFPDGKKQSRCWELDEKRGLAGKWEQLFLSKRVKKINRLSPFMILSLIPSIFLSFKKLISLLHAPVNTIGEIALLFFMSRKKRSISQF